MQEGWRDKQDSQVNRYQITNEGGAGGGGGEEGGGGGGRGREGRREGGPAESSPDLGSRAADYEREVVTKEGRERLTVKCT